MFMTVVTVAPAGSAIESAAQSMVDDLSVVAADAGTCNLTSILPDMRSVLDDIAIRSTQLVASPPVAAHKPQRQFHGRVRPCSRAKPMPVDKQYLPQRRQR